MRIYDPKNENGVPLLNEAMLEKAYVFKDVTVPSEGSVVLGVNELGDMPANYELVSAKLEGVDIVPETSLNGDGDLVLQFWMPNDYEETIVHLVFANRTMRMVGQTVEEPPKPAKGELRLYGNNGQYTVIPWSVGSVVVFGTKEQEETCNLNTATSLGYLYYQKTNVRILDGITFANVATMSRAFYQANGVVFNGECKYLGSTTNDYTYYGTKNIEFEREVKLTGNCTGIFASAQSTVVFKKGIDFTNATILDGAFHSSQIVLPHKDGVLEVNTNATDMRGMFYNMPRSGVKKLIINAPKCTTCCNMAVTMTGLQEVYVDLPKCTTCETNTSLGGYRFGVCGQNQSVRKVTTIMPSLVNGAYLCESAYGCVEWYGDISSASGLQAGFSGWVMDAASVSRIAANLKTWTSGTHAITLGINKDLQTDQGVLDDIQTIRSKGWTVAVQYNAPS